MYIHAHYVNTQAFFVHHSQVERIYMTWRGLIGNSKATDEDPCGGWFAPGMQPPGHNLHDVFSPAAYTFGTRGGESSFSVCKNLLGGETYVYDSMPCSGFSLAACVARCPPSSPGCEDACAQSCEE